MVEPTALQSPRIAVDTNFVFDCSDSDNQALEALETIRERTIRPVLIIPPTVCQELVYKHKRASSIAQQQRIKKAASDAVRRFGFQPVNLVAVGNGIVERIGDELRQKQLLPEEEKNDSFILAESCLLGCNLLITKDSHLLGMDDAEAGRILTPYGTPTLPIHPRQVIKAFRAK